MKNNSESVNQKNIQHSLVEKSFPSFNQALGLIGILLLISIIVAIPLAIVRELIDTGLKSIMNAAGYVLSFGILLFIGIYMRKSGKFLWQRISWQVILLLIPLVFSAGILLEPLIDAIPMPETVKKAFEEFITNDIFSFVTIVIIAPVLEELIFRGIILDGFLKRYSPVNAILLSSLFFGIAHMNPWQFIAAFGLGLLIGWIYWKSNSLIPCIVIHFLNNLFAYLMIMYSGDSATTIQNLMGDNKLYYVLYGICTVMFIGSFFLIMQRLKLKNE